MALSDTDLAAFNTRLKAVVAAHPELAALAQQANGQTGGKMGLARLAPFVQALQQYGISMPPNTTWNESTQSFENHESGWKMALAGLAAMATIGFAGPIVTALSAGGGGAGAAAAPSVGDVLASSTVGAAAPGIVSAAAPSLVSRVLTSPTLYSTIAGTVANIYGANKAASTALDAAQIQADASKYGVDAQTKATEAALAFQRQQAEAAYQASDAASRGNYGQWAARERRLGDVGALIGAKPREIPDYVQQPDPMLNGGGTPGAPSPAPSVGQVLSNGPAAPVDGSAASISAYFKSRGASDAETPYWVSKWPELVARGKEINNPNYAMQRLAAADTFGGGGGSSAAPAPAPARPTMPLTTQPGSVGQLLAQYGAPVISPQPYAPYSVGSYV